MSNLTKEPLVGPAATVQESRGAFDLPVWRVADEIRSQFRRVAAMLGALKGDGYAVGLCSSAPGEGVTWVTGMLGCAVAEGGRSVMLADAGRRADLCRMFEATEDGEGLSRPSLSDFVVHGTGAANLSIASPRFPGAMPADGWAGAITALRSLAPAILVDCGSVAGSPRVFHLARCVDGAVLVVEAERERRDALAATAAALRAAGIPVLGVVLNKRRRHGPALIHKYL